MKWIANLTDESGNIITGYEQELEGNRKEVLADYQYFLFLERDEEVPPERIDLEPIDY